VTPSVWTSLTARLTQTIRESLGPPVEPGTAGPLLHPARHPERGLLTLTRAPAIARRWHCPLDDVLETVLAALATSPLVADACIHDDVLVSATLAPSTLGEILDEACRLHVDAPAPLTAPASWREERARLLGGALAGVAGWLGEPVPPTPDVAPVHGTDAVDLDDATGRCVAAIALAAVRPGAPAHLGATREGRRLAEAHARVHVGVRYARRGDDPAAWAGRDEMPGEVTLTDVGSQAVVVTLLDAPRAARAALRGRTTDELVRLLVRLAGALDRFYDHARLTTRPDPESRDRVRVAAAAGQLLRSWIGLMGGEPPQRMGSRKR